MVIQDGDNSKEDLEELEDLAMMCHQVFNVSFVNCERVVRYSIPDNFVTMTCLHGDPRISQR